MHLVKDRGNERQCLSAAVSDGVCANRDQSAISRNRKPAWTQGWCSEAGWWLGTHPYEQKKTKRIWHFPKDMGYPVCPIARRMKGRSLASALRN